MTVRVRSGSVRAHGTDIYYEEAGAGPPVVLLHGLGDSHRTWRQVLPAFAENHRVLMPDLPGFGRSARPDVSYTLAWNARVLGAWLEQLELEDVDLVGHSYGGGVAQFMLLSHRARIRRIALVASGGLGREVAWELRLVSASDFVERFGQPFIAAATQRAMRQSGANFAPEDARWLREAGASPHSARAFTRTVRDVINWRGQCRSFLDHVREVPELPAMALFWGEQDRMIPLKHAFESARILEGVTVTTFEGCGHFPHHQVPDEFSRAVLQFLDTASAEPARLSDNYVRPPPRSPLLREMTRDQNDQVELGAVTNACPSPGSASKR